MLVAIKIFPYRTKGDLYRHALSRHVKYLEWLADKLKKPIPSVTAATDAIITTMRQIEFQMELNKVIDKLSGLISELVGRGAETEAKRLILEIKREIEGMPAGYWRDRYVSDISDRFGYLLDKVEKASLLKLATGEE